MLFTCITIFLARILDVSISTFRSMLMVKGKNIWIQILAFMEALVWFIAARQALNTNINSILIPICYSLGYATGTYIGGALSRRIIKDVNSIEVITKRNNYKLIDKLRDEGMGVSIIALKDNYDKPKDLLIVDVKSRLTKEVVDLVKKEDSEAFIVVKDTRIVHNGYIK